MRRRREGGREQPLCFASNYYLAHLAQSAQISRSEFGSPRPRQQSGQPLTPAAVMTQELSPLLPPWGRIAAAAGKCCLRRKCLAMTTLSAGWLLSLIHHSHLLPPSPLSCLQLISGSHSASLYPLPPPPHPPPIFPNSLLAFIFHLLPFLSVLLQQIPAAKLLCSSLSSFYSFSLYFFYP